MIDREKDRERGTKVVPATGSNRGRSFDVGTDLKRPCAGHQPSSFLPKTNRMLWCQWLPRFARLSLTIGNAVVDNGQHSVATSGSQSNYFPANPHNRAR